MAGEPSSIVQAPGDNTLRRNFQQIQVRTSSDSWSDKCHRVPTCQQEGRTLSEPPPPSKESRSKKGEREEIPDPGPPARPPLPQRLIGE